MIALRHSLFRHRHLAMLALVLAFALRALVPQGMMTAPDAARGITVLLCDGSGAAARVAVPLGENPGKAQPSQSCPFAVLAQAAIGDAPPVWTVGPRAAAPLPAALAPIPAEPHRDEHIQPPARAPPVAA